MTMQTLFNIPIDLSNNNRVLCERDGNIHTRKQKDCTKKDSGTRRKWLRARGKENPPFLMDHTQLAESSAVGQKRQWKLVDEKEDQNESVELLKRRKSQFTIVDENMNEVVVASLNQSQANQ